MAHDPQPHAEGMIRLTIPSIEEDDLQAVREVLASGYLVQGAQVAAFEEAVAQAVGTTHAVAVSNCTAALHLALLALDVRPGDMVLVTTYSWIATANVIELCGAQPVFVDICPDTFNMDPAQLEQTLQRLMAQMTTARRVRAVLPVHTFGQVAAMPAILECTRRYDLPVIEDAACALGATWGGQQAGSLGHIGCFSFHPRKAITTGEGGMLTTSDDLLAARLRALRNHGMEQVGGAAASDFVVPGFNYRLTDFQAALGVSQMAKRERIVAARRRLAAVYDSLLQQSGVQAPVVPAASTPVYQSYVVLLPASARPHRQAIISQLKERGIETTIGTIHMPMTGYFRSRYGYRTGDFATTDQIAARALTLPLHEFLHEPEQHAVISHLLALLKEHTP